MRSPEEAVTFLKELKAILEYSEVSDCRMEQGSLRCDANISIREIGQEQYNTKVEIKNLNSFKEVGKALEKEERRQKELYGFGEGHKVKQETRKWDAGKGRTIPMRSKEDAHDYRYFPEPDLPPVFIKEELIEEISSTLPELPRERSIRFIKEYGLREKEVGVLVADKALAEYYEEVVSFGCKPKEVANWVTVEVLRAMKQTEEIPVKAEYLANLIKLVDKGTISRSAAKEVFGEVIDSKKDPEEIVKEKGLSQISGEEVLKEVVDKVLSANPKAVEDFKNGKGKAVGFLVGQIMKETKGQANPAMAREILTKSLSEI